MTACYSLLYLPFAIANALMASLNDGVPWVDESLVLLGYCAFTGTGTCLPTNFISRYHVFWLNFLLFLTQRLYLHFATSVVHEITTTFCFRRACKVENGAAQGRFLVDTKCKQGISTFACFRHKT
ncbi:hypothetical protein DVH24_040539 [Malus domestica]|uniref:Uncharacterized protein n=1 Tax=Malus domestica TaxID=3750 RepID=A0A498IB51_MALDO|nr:hypothetical protein DVH24_040539 [Malus domestica]